MVHQISSASIPPVLIVDDEEHILRSFKTILRAGGISETVTCQDSREVMSLLSSQTFSAALLDLTMPHITGQELLYHFTERHPEIPVIVVTGESDLRVAIDCMKAGAYDYLTKPPDEEELLSSVRRAIEAHRLRAEIRTLKKHLLSEEIRQPECFSAIITRSSAMLALFRYLEAVAESDEPILITGETGVGKELFARAVHDLSRPESPFVAVNVAGLEDQAFADTLFGHMRGAFTGADDRRDGLIKRAAGGTLFLDEIGDLTPSSQVKLLRLLQEREYFPLGSDIAQLSNARIVASTHHDLDALIHADTFRSDLYYRFRTHQVHIPPLRERKEDLALLLEHFLEHAATQFKKTQPTPPPELLPLLATYDFPGNIRELKAMILDAVGSHSAGVLSMKVFESTIAGGVKDRGESPPASESPFTNLKVLPTLKEVSALLVDEAMQRSGGNQSLAARLVGVSPSALNQRLKKHKDGND